MDKIPMRIQRNHNLNDIYVSNEPEDLHNGVHHKYAIYKAGCNPETSEPLCVIYFQKGPRKEDGSTHGPIESDLLEIVRDRIMGHQNTEYRTRENACVLTHVEEALMWSAKRSDDRAERGVLGTVNK